MATVAWLGAAVPVPQEGTLVLGGTWSAADTISLTINGKTLTLTVGTTVTLPTILDELVNMFDGTAIDNAAYDRTNIADNVGEFAGLTATEDGTDTLTLTGESDGRPFTLTAAKSSTSGTISWTNAAVAATGPHHFDDVDNWDGGAVPSDSDDIVFDQRAASSLKYALDQADGTGGGTITPASITVTEGFQYSIGLPDVNTTTTGAYYDEYLPTYLELGDDADASPSSITVDLNPASTAGIIKLNTGNKQVALTNRSSGQRTNSEVPATLWIGTDASNTVTVSGGDFGVGVNDGEAATIATLVVNEDENSSTVELGDSVTLTTVNIYAGSFTSDSATGTLNISSGTHKIASATTLYLSGGTIVCDGAITTLTMNAGTATVKGNVTTLTMDGGVAHHVGTNTIGTLTIRGGTMYYRSSGTISTLVVADGGTIDFRKDNRGRTVSAATVYKGASYFDPLDTVTLSAGIVFTQTAPDEMTRAEWPRNKTWTPS